MDFKYLDVKDLHTLVDAVEQCGLIERRSDLLVGLPASYIAGLAKVEVPKSQILRDLDTFNQIRHLADHSVPMQIWLINAKHLTKALPLNDVFTKRLDQLSILHDWEMSEETIKDMIHQLKTNELQDLQNAPDVTPSPPGLPHIDIVEERSAPTYFEDDIEQTTPEAVARI